MTTVTRTDVGALGERWWLLNLVHPVADEPTAHRPKRDCGITEPRTGMCHGPALESIPVCAAKGNGRQVGARAAPQPNPTALHPRRTA